MEKSEIMNVLMKNLKAALPELKDVHLEPHQSMTEVGANSLDVVDVVSTTMRELKIKVSRDELSKIKTVGDLVDSIHAAQQKG